MDLVLLLNITRYNDVGGVSFVDLVLLLDITRNTDV